jgi:hypothetical protein
VKVPERSVGGSQISGPLLFMSLNMGFWGLFVNRKQCRGRLDSRTEVVVQTDQTG